MQAKVRELITLKDECEFFDLIEKKMKEQGFEVLETLSPKAEKKPEGMGQSHSIDFGDARIRLGRLVLVGSRTDPSKRE